MPPICRVIICGNSIFLMAIEAGLASSPNMKVIRLDPGRPDVVNRIAHLNPDAVVLDQNDASGELVLALLNSGVSLIQLNLQANQATLFSRDELPISSADDMARLIEQIGR